LPEIAPGLLDQEEQEKRQVHEFADRVRQEDDRGGEYSNQDEDPPVILSVSDKRFHKPDAT
jgi:hypothetical protein